MSYMREVRDVFDEWAESGKDLGMETGHADAVECRLLVTHYLCGQGDLAWEVRSSQAEGRLTLGLAGPGPDYL